MDARTLPDVQLSLRAGIVEFGWGHPDLRLLPADDIARAAEIALRRYGSEALSYGAEQGPGMLIERLCDWLKQREGLAFSPEQLFITGGVSQALDLLCTLFTQPGDVMLVESPTYHLALRIFRDHGLELVPIASDEQGLRIDALVNGLEDLRQSGQSARFLYTVPTFGNPTGISLALDRRRVLLAVAQEAGLTVLEDDVYRELWYDSPALPALSSLAPEAPVMRLGSFSKILAPGLRLGWLVASSEIVQRCVRSGLLDSGGGVNHLTAHLIATFMELGLPDKHIERLRAVYRQRRDVLLDALTRFLPRECSWIAPGGGFFVWVRLPDGCDSLALLPIAETAGVSYVPGDRFCVGGGGEQYIRLAFSFLPLQELEEGARRLGALLDTRQAPRVSGTLRGVQPA